MKLGINRVPGVRLPSVLLAVGLAFCALNAARAATTNGSPSDGLLSASLVYQETAQAFINSGLGTSDQATPFKKEPQLAKGPVRRGRLEFAAAGQPALPFLWDQSRGDLYLDLNRNEDLTDDPAGVFHTRSFSNSGSNYRYASFAGVRLMIQTKAGSYPWLADLNFSEFSGQLSVYAAQRSFWSAKLNLAGRDYQVGLVTCLTDRSQDSSSGYLLLRPWARQAEPFHVTEGSLDAIPFANQLFFNQRLYRVERSWVAGGDQLNCRLTLAETPAAVGELQLSGKFIRRLLLTQGPCTALLDSPDQVVQIPVGRYQDYQVQLGQGDAFAHLDRSLGMQPRPVVVTSNSLANLVVGGPLTNTASLSRHGSLLVLNYRLVGAGGDAYQLNTRGNRAAPRFAIYQGERQLASGNFEFG